MKKYVLNVSIVLLMVVSCLVAAPFNKVVITVGNQSITQMDIEYRLKFIALISGIQVNSSNRATLIQEITNMLVKENLEIEEMNNNGFVLNDDMILHQLDEFAQRIHIAPENIDTFFAQHGIPITTVKCFLTAQYAWPQYIRFRYPKVLDVSEDRIELLYQQQLSFKAKPRYLLAEIFIPVNHPSEESSVKKQINLVYQQVMQGGPFPMLAQQFSQAATARQGGNMGWTNLDFLPEKARNVIKALDVGQITHPTRLDEGYVIYAVIDRRLPGETSVKDMEFSVRQIIMNLDTLQETVITDELKKCKNCTQLEQTLEKYPFIHVEKDDHLIAQQMNPEFTKIIHELKDNTLSYPIRYPQGTTFLWVCNRKVIDNMLSKDEIKYNLIMQNITQKSRSILNRLSKSIWVEVKDPSYKID